jgi:site-specific DNA recombinase
MPQRNSEVRNFVLSRGDVRNRDRLYRNHHRSDRPRELPSSNPPSIPETPRSAPEMAVTAPQPAVAPPQLVGPTSASLTQFEREVTSERIRDKIAASKRKGIWVGGNLPLGYQMQDGKIAIVEEEAELVRAIYRRYLELGSVNELLRDLKERNVRTKSRLLSTGVTRGGIPFGRGALYYVLSNHFYVGEVKYKGEILPGEQPPIMDRTLFDAVRQKSLARWSRRTTLRNKADHLLAGLLFDDAGYRMIPTHATKAGVRYRYYASTPVLHGEAKTASTGSISRIPAAEVEDTVVKSVASRSW